MENAKMQQTLQTLRPYQKEAIEKMSHKHCWLECDDMGLGKTVTCLVSFLQRTDLTGKRVLILCGANAMGVWQEELLKWFDLKSTLYTGTPAKRAKILDTFKEHLKETHFLITTYAMLKELPRGWEAVFVDEYHLSGLIKHTNKFSITFESHRPYFKNTYLITGTPIRQGVVDLYNPLHLMDPTTFPSYWSFVNRYCIVIQTPFGKQIERNPKNIPAFRELLDNYMVRRLKSEVLHDLPGKQRNVVPVYMTAKQHAAYNSLAEDFILQEDDESALTIAPNQMVTDLRLRQLLVCPRLLGIDDDGAGFAYLSEVVPELLQANRPAAIFSPFREVLPLLEDLIKGWNLNTSVYKIMGGMTPAAFANQWQGFQKNPRKNKVLLGVIKSGTSFHATEAADCFFLGYEWDFNMNVQAEDRLCRLGQHNFVNCNYILHQEDTIDEAVKQRLNEKQLAADWIIGTPKQYKELLRKVRKTHGV